MTTPEPETQQPPEAAPQYQVSFERLAQLKRSPITLVAARRPASCPSREKPDHELTDAKKLVDEVAKFSKNEENFIESEMPLQEIVFRILLTRRNRPTLLSDLHYELTEKWATPMRPINISQEALIKILDADTYYGFLRIDPPDEKAKA